MIEPVPETCSDVELSDTSNHDNTRTRRSAFGTLIRHKIHSSHTHIQHSARKYTNRVRDNILRHSWRLQAVILGTVFREQSGVGQLRIWGSFQVNRLAAQGHVVNISGLYFWWPPSMWRNDRFEHVTNGLVQIRAGCKGFRQSSIEMACCARSCRKTKASCSQDAFKSNSLWPSPPQERPSHAALAIGVTHEIEIARPNTISATCLRCQTKGRRRRHSSAWTTRAPPSVGTTEVLRWHGFWLATAAETSSWNLHQDWLSCCALHTRKHSTILVKPIVTCYIYFLYSIQTLIRNSHLQLLHNVGTFSAWPIVDIASSRHKGQYRFHDLDGSSRC